MPTKLCKKCQQVKSTEDFHKRKQSIDGLQPKCKQCAIEKAKDHYHKDPKATIERAYNYTRIFRDAVKLIKQKYGCQKCGFDNSTCLQFHHVDASNKTTDIARLAQSKNIYLLIKEINKCVVLCSNCHILHHNNEIDISNIESCNESIEDFKEYLILSGKATKKFRNRKNKRYNPRSKCICGNYKHVTSKLCCVCAKVGRRLVDRPTKEELQELLSRYNYTKVGKMFGVSDNAIRKWEKYTETIMYYI